MRGSRVKKLRHEAHQVYLDYIKKRSFKSKPVLPFKSVFRQVKKMYMAGLPIFQKKREIAWPTSR